MYKFLKTLLLINLGEWFAQVKLCENGQLSRKAKVVREPTSRNGYGNTVPSIEGVTTIESITRQKFSGEEVSRVGRNPEVHSFAGLVTGLALKI